MKPSIDEKVKHPHILEYNKKYRGITSAKTNPTRGKRYSMNIHTDIYAAFRDHVIKATPEQDKWKLGLLTQGQIAWKKFERVTRNHSFTQEACFEICIHPIITSGYLDYYGFSTLCKTNSIIPHLTEMIIKCSSYEFTWLAYKYADWKQQTTMPQDHALATLAALFHYRMHATDVLRFLGGTYTGEHRDIDTIVNNPNVA